MVSERTLILYWLKEWCDVMRFLNEICPLHIHQTRLWIFSVMILMNEYKSVSFCLNSRKKIGYIIKHWKLIHEIGVTILTVNTTWNSCDIIHYFSFCMWNLNQISLLYNTFHTLFSILQGNIYFFLKCFTWYTVSRASNSVAIFASVWVDPPGFQNWDLISSITPTNPWQPLARAML